MVDRVGSRLIEEIIDTIFEIDLISQISRRN